MAGRFLVLEGVDGTGKTTQARRLIERWERDGHEPLHLREPGVTPLGEHLRKMLLSEEREGWTPRTESLLFFAARSEMLQREVAPALQAGRWVLCERFTPSTLAYQGQRPEDAEFILKLDEWVVAPEWQPDLVVILDLDPRESLARAGARAELDGFEGRGLEYLERVRQGYRRYASARPEHTRWLSVSGQDPDQVAASLQACLEEAWS